MEDLIYAIHVIKGLICDVNINEITEHIKNDNLNRWIVSWKDAINYNLNVIKREVDKIDANRCADL